MRLWTVVVVWMFTSNDMTCCRFCKICKITHSLSLQRAPIFLTIMAAPRGRQSIRISRPLVNRAIVAMKIRNGIIMSEAEKREWYKLVNALWDEGYAVV